MRSPGGGLTCSPGGLGDLSILPCLTVPRPGLAETVPMLGLAEGAGRLASLPGVVAREEDCVQVSLLLATLAAWLAVIINMSVMLGKQ